MESQDLIGGLAKVFAQPLSVILMRFLAAILILIIGRLIAKALSATAVKAMVRAKVDETLVAFLKNITHWVLLLIVIVIALGVLGFPTSSIVAILGAATLAIGLALKDFIANLASGITIIALRPFRVGDYVELNDETGFVSEIRLFHTLLTTRDNKEIFLPNKDVLGSNITNYSNTELIRLDLVYGIGYGDDILKAKRILDEIVAEDDRIAKEPPPIVAVKELGDSSVNLTVRPFVKVEDEPAVVFTITEQVKLRFDKAGISIPFPQRDVHIFQPN